MSVSHPDIAASACANVAKAVLGDVPPFESDPVVEMYHVALIVGSVEVFTVTVCVDVTEPAVSVAVSV
jgi:hypothetical protein